MSLPFLKAFCLDLRLVLAMHLTPRVAQKCVSELFAESYPCLVFGNRPYQSHVFAEYERLAIESRDFWGGGSNSKAAQVTIAKSIAFNPWVLICVKIVIGTAKAWSCSMVTTASDQNRVSFS